MAHTVKMDFFQHKATACRATARAVQLETEEGSGEEGTYLCIHLNTDHNHEPDLLSIFTSKCKYFLHLYKFMLYSVNKILSAISDILTNFCIFFGSKCPGYLIVLLKTLFCGFSDFSKCETI